MRSFFVFFKFKVAKKIKTFKKPSRNSRVLWVRNMADLNLKLIRYATQNTNDLSRDIGRA